MEQPLKYLGNRNQKKAAANFEICGGLLFHLCFVTKPASLMDVPFQAFPLEEMGEMMKFRINSLVRKTLECYNITKIARSIFFCPLHHCRVKQAAGEHPRRK